MVVVQACKIEKKKQIVLNNIFRAEFSSSFLRNTPFALFRTKTRLNDVFAMDLALRNSEYKERSGNQVLNGLQATVMN